VESGSVLLGLNGLPPIKVLYHHKDKAGIAKAKNHIIDMVKIMLNKFQLL